MTKKTLTLKKSGTKSDADTEKKTVKSTLSLGGKRRKKLTIARKKPEEDASTESVQDDNSTLTSGAGALTRPARKRRNQRVIVNPNAKRKKKPLKKVAKKVVKQQPKKKKKKEPPKKQRRPLRVKTMRSISQSNMEAKELDARLTELYNVWSDFKPLEVGIDIAVLELISNEGWGYSKRVMRKTFKLHVRNMSYREMIAQGGKRYNLNNEPVEDIHDFSMMYAQVYVDRRAARIIREKNVMEEMENAIAADRLKAQEAKSNRLSL